MPSTLFKIRYRVSKTSRVMSASNSASPGQSAECLEDNSPEKNQSECRDTGTIRELRGEEENRVHCYRRNSSPSQIRDHVMQQECCEDSLLDRETAKATFFLTGGWRLDLDQESLATLEAAVRM